MNKISFGGGCINNADWHFANHNLPFGGVGNSGMGAYHGKYTFDTFTRGKSVMKTPTWFDPDFKYPPLKGKLSCLNGLSGNAQLSSASILLRNIFLSVSDWVNLSVRSNDSLAFS